MDPLEYIVPNRKRLPYENMIESNFTIAIHFIHDYILVYASANETLNNSPKEKRKDVRLLYLGIIGYICTQIKKT